MSNIRSPRVFHGCARERLQMRKRVQRGEKCTLFAAKAPFHVKWLYSFLYVQWQEFGHSLWGQKVSLLMSALFEGLSDIQAVVTPTIDGLAGKQVCVCACGCKTITCSTPPLRNWDKVRQMVNTPQLYFQMCWKSVLFPSKVFITFALGYLPWHESHTDLNHFQFTSEYIT